MEVVVSELLGCKSKRQSPPRLYKSIHDVLQATVDRSPASSSPEKHWVSLLKPLTIRTMGSINDLPQGDSISSHHQFFDENISENVSLPDIVEHDKEHAALESGTYEFYGAIALQQYIDTHPLKPNHSQQRSFTESLPKSMAPPGTIFLFLRTLPNLRPNLTAFTPPLHAQEYLGTLQP